MKRAMIFLVAIMLLAFAVDVATSERLTWWHMVLCAAALVVVAGGSVVSCLWLGLYLEEDSKR